jgi:hypothetical protein
MTADFLVQLFNFIKKEGKGDLDPDHYQIAFKVQGLGVVMVFRYLNASPIKELKLKVLP